MIVPPSRPWEIGRQWMKTTFDLLSVMKLAGPAAGLDAPQPWAAINMAATVHAMSSCFIEFQPAY